MVWNAANRLVLAEHRLRIVSTSACVAEAESARNGATFAIIGELTTNHLRDCTN
jgi:hypothetical protein